MRTVRLSKGREYDVPDTWEEAEKMMASAMKRHEKRGSNLALQAICARIAYGMYGERFMAADPNQALCFLMHHIAIREGAGL
jgi:hypothetical protein